MITDNGDSITLSLNLPVPVAFAQFALALAAFGLLVFAGAWLLTRGPDLWRWVKAQVISQWPKGHTAPNKVTKFAFALSPIGFVLFSISLWRLGVLLLVPPHAEGPVDFRVHYLAFVGVATFLIGLVGIPFAILRMHATERQTKAQEEGLITDRINKAVEGLGAEKTVKVTEVQKWLKPNPPLARLGDEQNFEIVPVSIENTVPNLEVRIGAIYALERIAQDSLRDHIQIMEILCAYIRENAPASSAKILPEPPDWYEGVSDTYDGTMRNWSGDLLDIDGEPVEGDNGKPVTGAFEKWKEDHEAALKGVKPRADIQTALTVIGRRSCKQKKEEWGEWRPFVEFEGGILKTYPEWQADSSGKASAAYVRAVEDWQSAFGRWKRLRPIYRIDLRETNLRRADIGGSANEADFSHARFERSDVQGANFHMAKTQRAYFWEAKAHAAHFSLAQMHGADFMAAYAHGAGFSGAQA